VDDSVVKVQGDRKGQLVTLRIFYFLSPSCPSVGGEMPQQLYYSTYVLFLKEVENNDFNETQPTIRVSQTTLL